jgi:hypothetical protein
MPNLLAYLSCVRSVALSRPNWSRRLPRPLKIPTVMMLKTLADVRELIARHLPAECRERDTWRHVSDRLATFGAVILYAVTEWLWLVVHQGLRTKSAFKCFKS